MVRTSLTALFFVTALAVSAQRPDFTPTDSKEMTANATKHMQLVDRSVNLTKEQKPKVQEIYMQVERQMQALNYRMQGQPKEDVEADMRDQYMVLDQYVDRELAKVLTSEQMTRWVESSR